MGEKYIYQHLGLGDHIICNGLVREIAKNNKVFLFVKEHNFDSVKAMFCDLVNISFIIGDDAYVREYLRKNNIKDLVKIGHEYLNTAKNFDRSFYEEAGYDFNLRWDNFYIQRNKIRENSLFEKLNLNCNEKYIFLHEDDDKGVKIDKSKIVELDMKIIYPDLKFTKNIIDYCGVLEYAYEIHCIPSSFMFLIDSIKTNDRLYLHRYTREYPDYCEPCLKKDWIIFK